MQRRYYNQEGKYRVTFHESTPREPIIFNSHFEYLAAITERRKLEKKSEEKSENLTNEEEKCK